MARRTSTPRAGGWYAYAPTTTKPPTRRQQTVRTASIERPPFLNVLELRSKGGLFIDGTSMKSIVADAERAAGERDAGGYEWLPNDRARAPSRHMLGEPAPDADWGDDWERYGFGEGSVAVGGCGCGSVGCHPLVVVIEFGDGLVRWSKFQTRASENLGIGPFVFDERQYRGALGFPR